MKLSIGMMVKNEEKHLRECLESLTPIREAIDSELVIIDTGSDDNTVAIAEEFTDRVYFHEWNDHFAEMRNKVIDYCEGDWIFVIDGDEVVKDPTGLINFFKTGLEDKYNTGLAEQRSYTDSRESHFGSLLMPRLFRLDGDFHYEGAVHNQPIFKNPVVDLEVTLLHYGYDSNDPELMERKFERTASILKQELEENPENIYYLYQLSKSYGMHQDHEEALEYIEKAYNILKEKEVDLENYLYVYSQYVNKLLTDNQFKQAKKICNEAIEIREGYLDFYYFKAGSLSKLGENEKAIYNYNVYLSLIDNYLGTLSRKDMAFVDTTLALENVAYSELARLYYKEENYREAVKYGLLVEEDRLQLALPWLIKAYLQLKKYEELKDYYINNLKSSSKELQEIFWEEIENAKLNLEQVNNEILVELFADIEGKYGLLNRVRLKLNSDQINKDNELISKIESLELNGLSYYYGDLIYYLLRLDYPIIELLVVTRESVISQFLGYLSEARDDIYELLLSFLKDQSKLNNIKQSRVVKVIAKFLLIKDKIKLEDYKFVFNKYITAGINYLKGIYSDYIIDNQLDYELDNNEDEFLLKMKLAKECKNSDDLLYVRYLKEALNKFPAMKKGISLLVSEIKDELEADYNLDENKDMLKEKLKAIINNGELDKAQELITEYEDKFGLDAEFCSIKATVSIFRGELEKAKNCLVSGLSTKSLDFDLLYNLGFVYESLGKEKEAYNVYVKAKTIAESKEEKKDVDKAINNLQFDENVMNQSDIKTYSINSSTQSLSCNPFFIIGCGRSGTTLLRSILNAHSDISIPPEFVALAELIKTYKNFNYISWNDLLNMIISVFKSTPHFSIWKVELSEIYEQLLDLEQKERTLAKIIDTIYNNFLQHNFSQAKIWGDKTPLNTLNIELIDEVFPDAKYIHLIRNGKDVVSSYLNSTKYVNSVERACARWNKHVSKGLEFKESQNKDEYLEVYYEDLVTNPSQEVEKICNLIGVEFNSTMLNYHDQLSKLDDTKAEQHKNLHKDINTDSIGKWEKGLNSFQKEKVDKLLTKNLRRLNYIE
ncbi:sulfotransferase [Sporohalobacter salinus]|uniref:sulfotransferase n=1 Tax=Sporohalobacter salinus TaxID=1494606 RepID=UPI0019618A68|nr:sulfotransferase [Sporohalobacter salinus]MBM7623039.1 glycosyltransferase involved in cell wall biosynthesis/LPS sulfotransferase NodH [Sporohalobacter salinus]